MPSQIFSGTSLQGPLPKMALSRDAQMLIDALIPSIMNPYGLRNCGLELAALEDRNKEGAPRNPHRLRHMYAVGSIHTHEPASSRAPFPKIGQLNAKNPSSRLYASHLVPHLAEHSVILRSSDLVLSVHGVCCSHRLTNQPPALRSQGFNDQNPLLN